MNPLLVTVFVYLFTVARAQQVGTQTAEKHPAVNLSKCTKAGGCKCEAKSVTLDANWRWLHEKTGTKNCYTGQDWDADLCKDGETCAANCALDGADYSTTYGITSTGDALTLKFITGANVGSRVYLMDGDDKYAMFKLKNQEFSFDVDVSNLPCGLNGALYFAEMDEDGGMKKFPTNKAGATYGTGYCDAQCPHDIKFISGKANVENWTPSKTDKNTGTGKYGSCCPEMDIWEANKMSQAYTPHTCTVEGQTICDGEKCGDDPSNRYGGVCDKDGCDFASFRLGAPDFYGPNKTVDSTKKFTVVTQFITHDGTAAGDLSEIRRLYVQDGKVIQNTKTKLPGLKPAFDSITDSFCAAEKTLFGDKNDFAAKGGLKSMGGALERGMVLVMSLWDDHMVNMLWLDSNYPTDKPATTPGVARGTCDAASGDPKVVEVKSADASVTFSNIKIGDLNSTYGTTTAGSSCGASTTSPSTTSPSTGSASSPSPTMRRTRKA